MKLTDYNKQKVSLEKRSFRVDPHIFSCWRHDLDHVTISNQEGHICPITKIVYHLPDQVY